MSGLIYSIYLNGHKAIRFMLMGILPMFLTAAIFNPLFSHNGVTILFFHPNGNPITLESVLYGLAMGGMLATTMTWFSSFNKVLTSDKLVYLFGRFIPAMALIFTMSLRMVPRFKVQAGKIANAQACIGKGMSDGNILDKARNGVTIFSILITWALENGVESANSMKARGYGLKGRSHFSLFTVETRDKILLALLGVFTLIILIGSYLGHTSVQFFPWILVPPINTFSIIIFVVFGCFLSIPMILNTWEDRKWQSLK